jgi:hypothetical protein
VHYKSFHHFSLDLASHAPTMSAGCSFSLAGRGPARAARTLYGPAAKASSGETGAFQIAHATRFEIAVNDTSKTPIADDGCAQVMVQAPDFGHP